MNNKDLKLKGETRRFTAYLPSALLLRLKIRAAHADTSATALTRRYITEGLDRDEKPAGGLTDGS